MRLMNQYSAAARDGQEQDGDQQGGAEAVERRGHGQHRDLEPEAGQAEGNEEESAQEKRRGEDGPQVHGVGNGHTVCRGG
jgi:hypothetical protein